MVEVQRAEIPYEPPAFPAWEIVYLGKATHLGKTSGYGVNGAYGFRGGAIEFHLKGKDVTTLVEANGYELEITNLWR